MKKNTTTTWLPVRALYVNPTVQRRLDEKRAQKIADNFDPTLMGVIHVSDHNGPFHVIDGQHRLHAVKLLGWSDQRVECKVYEGLTRAQEAALFAGLNDFAKVRNIDRFIVNVIAGDSIAVEINDIVQRVGLEVTTSSKDGGVTAVTSLEAVYLGRGTRQKGKHPDILEQTLRIVTTAWGYTAEAVDGRVVHGIGTLLLYRGEAVSTPDLVKKLAKYPGGPSALVGAARGLKGIRGGTIQNCIAELVTDLYNRGRRANKLPDWRS